MKRYNAFYLIHKALRAMLYNTAIILQQTDFANIAEAQKVILEITDVVYAFERHAHHEDSFINPAVEVYEAELATAFENEHVEDHRLSNVLKNLLAIYENAFLPEEKSICGSAIIKSFTEFLVFNLQHMAKEEMFLNQALWKHYTDEQIMAIEHQLIATIPPQEMQNVSRWMIYAISTQDAIEWLNRVKHSSPGFVFSGLMQIAKEELSEERFEVIAAALKEEAAVA